ncbi:hypothetical protein KY345_05510 [Candidatus Woesearchaeota archaeon]|nr:hypothetical protein [Candidatus Woesearchaeota archaeon]
MLLYSKAKKRFYGGLIMVEWFNLWEYADVTKHHSIEATKDDYHGFANKMNHIGRALMDIKEIKLSSNGLPLLPLKPAGELENICKSSADPEQMISAAIFTVDINGILFGYLATNNDHIYTKKGSIFVNGRKRVALNAYERRALKSVSAIDGQPLEANWHGWIGRVNVHAVTVAPKKGKNYSLCCIAIRDYFM